MKLTEDHRLKVLDFGLAKALPLDSGASPSDPVTSPTITMRASMSGVIMGTAAYMSGPAVFAPDGVIPAVPPGKSEKPQNTLVFLLNFGAELDRRSTENKRIVRVRLVCSRPATKTQRPLPEAILVRGLRLTIALPPFSEYAYRAFFRGDFPLMGSGPDPGELSPEEHD